MFSQTARFPPGRFAFGRFSGLVYGQHTCADSENPDRYLAINSVGVGMRCVPSGVWS